MFVNRIEKMRARQRSLKAQARDLHKQTPHAPNKRRVPPPSIWPDVPSTGKIHHYFVGVILYVQWRLVVAHSWAEMSQRPRLNPDRPTAVLTVVYLYDPCTKCELKKRTSSREVSLSGLSLPTPPLTRTSLGNDHKTQYSELGPASGNQESKRNLMGLGFSPPWRPTQLECGLDDGSHLALENKDSD
ncbi:11639_t:CDS:2, partial [Acaulospora colombiana]